MHHVVDSARIPVMCALIFISCAGLGAAAFWVTTRTEEAILIREVRMVIRALFIAALAAWVLLIVTPDELVVPVGAFFVVFAFIVGTLLWMTRRRIIKKKVHK